MSIVIHFDYPLFLIGLVWYWVAYGVVNIMAGLVGGEREARYGPSEVIGGVSTLLWVLVCLVL